jgi:acyl phosphate:glycerol-3-phosphate acyltransferase
MITLLIGALLAYLLGSIPSAVWYGKFFHKVDVRTLGSGNAGATNTLRNLGKTAGIIVLLIDVLKGYLAVSLADFLQITEHNSTAKLVFGLLAIAGHLYPIFAEFRGGKGVASALGVILALLPIAALIAAFIFTIVLLSTRYVSLSSILGAVSFPISALFLCSPEQKMDYFFFGIIVAFIIVFKHKTNVKKLLKGQESKVGEKK